MTPTRTDTIGTFLERAGWGDAVRTPLPGDASFRRYVRLNRGSEAALLMDAPPPKEDVRRFAAIARHLNRLGFSAPAVLAIDVATGLLLIEDFGDETYSRLLSSPADEPELYVLATDLLIELHRQAEATAIDLPPYDDRRFLEEAVLFADWYLPAIRRAPLSEGDRAAFLDLWRDVLPTARAVPETLVLRDYHVDNLMRVAGREGVRACGLLDFQDAVIGPATYDLMSLVEDARRDVDATLAATLVDRYLAAFPDVDADAFRTSLAILGAQRHAKVIGIFTRLDRRDGKPAYLDHIPRVWRLFERALDHPSLTDLRNWIDRTVPEDQRRVPDRAAAPR